MISEAFDLVAAASHPSPENGGPCATCAFRPGTQAHESAHTVQLAKMCVEGVTPFDCHEKPQLCRGWIAAVNVIAHDGLPADEESKRWREAARAGAEIMVHCIALAKAEQDAHEEQET